jgi:hypothetical protein
MNRTCRSAEGSLPAWPAAWALENPALTKSGLHKKGPFFSAKSWSSTVAVTVAVRSVSLATW